MSLNLTLVLPGVNSSLREKTSELPACLADVHAGSSDS